MNKRDFFRFSARISLAGALLAISGCGSDHTQPCVNCGGGGNHSFVYTANAAGSPSTVSAYTSDSASGALESITGSPYNTGSGSRALAKNPANGRLYVANSLSGDISGFVMDLNTGGLNAISGSPFAAESGMDSIAISSNGQFLYAVSGNSANLWAYSIDASGGLTPLAGTPMLISASASASNSVLIDPSGKYLYAATGNSQGMNLYGYSVDSASGALTLLSGFPLALYGFASHSAFDSAGKFLFVTGTNVFGASGGVEVFSFDSSTGGLTLGLGSPVQAGDDPSGVAVDGTGKYV